MSSRAVEPRRRAPRRRTVRPPRWHLVLVGVVAALYLAAVIAGATTSSLGVASLQPSGQPDPHHLGNLQPVRSDEYNAMTPIQLSMLATGGAPTLSPMGADASLVHRYPIGPIQSVVFWDTWLLRLGPVLPDAQLFAAHWWLPTLLVLLCMPTWFVLMGGRRHLGWLAGALIAFAPSNFWWSLQPTMLLAYVLAGCTAMLAAARRLERGERWIPALQIAAAGICIAGMPSNYLLWSMLLGGGVLLASSVRLLTRWNRGSLIALGATGLLAAGLGAGAMWEGRAGLLSITDTVYPGSRREGAQALDPGFLFGAPVLNGLVGETPQGTNASELSTALNLTVLLIPFAWIAGPRLMRWRARLPELVLALWAGLWLLWGMVDLGTIGTRLPIASSVPPDRAAQAIGVVGTIALCLALSHVRRGNRAMGILAGAAMSALTLYCASRLRGTALPHLDLTLLWGAGLAVGVCVALLIAAPRRWYPPAIAALCAVLVVWNASPLQFGLGGWRGDEISREVAAQGAAARTDGSVWVSDDFGVSTMLLANGVPVLSGLQRSGPDVPMWRRIDPDGAFEHSWNRAGGYSDFAWREGGPTTITDDGFDAIFTTIDPCTLAREIPEVGHIVSRSPLENSSCLEQESTFTWQGEQRYVYAVRDRG